MPFKQVRFEYALYFLLILLIPIQLGKHFWPSFAHVSGLRIDYLSPTLYLTDIFIGILFVVWIKKSWKHLIYGLFAKNHLLLKITCCVFLINVLHSTSLLVGSYVLLRFFEFLFFGWYTAHDAARGFSLKAFTSRIALLFGFGIFFESLLVYAQYFSQRSLNGIFYFFGERYITPSTPGAANVSLDGTLVLRPYGTFSHPNVLAGYLLLAMTFILFTVKKNIVWITLLILTTFALILSMSRTAMVVWISVLLLRAAFLSQRKDALWQFCLAGLVILVTGLFLSTRFLPVSLFDESFLLRKTLNESAIHMIQQNTFLGVGLGNFLVMLPSFLVLQAVGSLQPVHSIYLLLTAELGLLGVIMVIFFVGKTLWFLLREDTHKEHAHISLVLIGIIAVIGLLDHYWLTLQQGQLLLAFTLGFCWIRNFTKSDTIQKK